MSKPGSPSEPFLLTPGPLTTARATKEAMLRDWGSRDPDFIKLNAQIRERLVAIVGGQGTYVCVPVQGSGTFAVEATLGTLLPRAGAKALVLINGAYGTRMAKMLSIMGRPYAIYETAEDAPPDPAELDRRLAADPSLTHVLFVHCETTAGILNPLEKVADVVAKRGRRLIVDAMSAFGAIPIDSRKSAFDAVIASSNKNLEGVPGMGYAIIKKNALAAAKGNAHSLSLDLHDQWQGFEKNAQWRFTPPTHVIAAFAKALDLFDAEGGVAGRNARYAANCRILVDGMRALGFETLLPDHLQAPIIVTFRMPADPKFKFETFYESLKAQGYVIYPGKLTVADSFRMGCIGQLGATEMKGALDAVKTALKQLGVSACAPARAA